MNKEEKDKIINEACDEAKKFSSKALSTEFYFNFPNTDREDLQEVAELCFIYGYIRAKGYE